LNKLWIQGISFILFLAALPLISFGTTSETELLWMAGIAIFIFAAILPPITRFMDRNKTKKENKEEKKK
jgi:hypothetical protein